MVPLGKLGEIISGSTPNTNIKDYWNGDIPWVTPANLTNHEGIYFKGRLRKITKAGYNSCSARMLPPGSIIFSSRAPIGHCAVTAYPLCTNQGFKSIAPNENLDAIYGFFALTFFTPQIIARGRGATFLEVSKEIIEDFPIPLPPLTEQKRVAAILEKADHLRRLRRYARKLSDTYLKSVFLKTFGDPVTNPMGWDKVFLEKLAYGHNGIVDGPFGSSVNTEVDYIPEGEIPVIRTKNVGVFEFIEDDLKFITRKKFESLTRSRVIPGDIVLTKVGTIGQLCIFPGHFEEAVLSTTGSCKITPDISQVDRTFLIHSLYAMRGYMNQVASKAVQSFLNMTMVKEIPIIIPPRHLQDEFAIIASKCERLCSQQREAERQAEHLFQTLLNKTFSGELN